MILISYIIYIFNKIFPTTYLMTEWEHINGSVQDYGNSIADALELPQSCAKPGICQGLSTKQ